MAENFSGIGCQRRGIENTGLFDLEVVSTSDINRDATVIYAAMHHGLTDEMVENYDAYPSREQMVSDLTKLNLGYVPEKKKTYDWTKLARRKKMDIEKFWLACKLSNNLGDISKIEKLPYADLWTISSPCTDISISGKLRGLAPDSGTRSSLLWDNVRLIKEACDRGEAPKFLFFENVKNLVGKRFEDDFDTLCDVLKEELGYNCYYAVLNAADCGVPQHRERVFLIGIRSDIDNGKFEFPKPFDNGLRLKDVLDQNVDEKYYVKSQRAIDLIKELFELGKITTLKARIRKLTPTECFKLQGLKPEDVEAARKCNISDSALYTVAGNGICCDCVELIFEHLYKALYDENYVCKDELMSDVEFIDI